MYISTDGQIIISNIYLHNGEPYIKVLLWYGDKRVSHHKINVSHPRGMYISKYGRRLFLDEFEKFPTVPEKPWQK